MRNRLINATAIMSLFICIASAYLMTTEYWLWAIFFETFGALWLVGYGRANFDRFVEWWCGNENGTPAAKQKSH